MSTREVTHRRPEWGQAISDAKQGVRLVERGDDELTAQQAAQETGLDARTLKSAAARGVVRHRVVERPGRQPDAIVFEQAQLLEDLAKCPCKYPGCGRPAPGPSGRCRRHRARGEPPVAKTCEQCGVQFKRHQSWLREREGRGRFCSDACQFAWQRANDARFANMHEPFDAGFAAAYQADVAAAIAAQNLYTTDQFANLHASASSVIRADVKAGIAPGEIVVYRDGQLLVGDAAAGTRGGTRRLVFPASRGAADTYRRAVAANDHRARYLNGDFMASQQQRTKRLLIGKGLSEDQAEAAVRAAAKKRRRAIRRRGPRPSAAPSPINVERAAAVEAARLKLQAEYEAGIRSKQVSARAARLRAARNIAATDSRLFPVDYVNDGTLRPHWEDAAIALLTKAENACKAA